jgi:hypothetical protein
LVLFSFCATQQGDFKHQTDQLKSWKQKTGATLIEAVALLLLIIVGHSWIGGRV